MFRHKVQIVRNGGLSGKLATPQEDILDIKMHVHDPIRDFLLHRLIQFNLIHYD
jgi:hypothetical protein